MAWESGQKVTPLLHVVENVHPLSLLLPSAVGQSSNVAVLGNPTLKCGWILLPAS